MADNYLITGYWGEPHITPENDRGINAAMFGKGRFVLPVGEQFKAEYIGNNTVRLYDGKLVDNGAVAGIPVGEYVDLLIPESGQGMNRNDLIVFQYSKDTSTLIESGKFVVLQGSETNETASDPELIQQDLLSNEATFDQMALYRVSVSGAEISTPVSVFKVSGCAPIGIDAQVFRVQSDDEIDNIIKSVWETMGDLSVKFITLSVEINYASLKQGMWFVQLNKANNSVGTIEAIYEHGNSEGIIKMNRVVSAAELQPWEWVNPLLVLGVEYRTIERFNNRPLYVKAIKFDTIKWNGIASITDEDIAKSLNVVSVSGIVYSSNGTSATIPYHNHLNSVISCNAYTSGKVCLYTNYDPTEHADYTMYEYAILIVKYTK